MKIKNFLLLLPPILVFLLTAYADTPSTDAKSSDLLRSTIPTVKAIGWPEKKKPTPREGLSVNAFAKNFDHSRWLYVLPNGDILVAESNRPIFQRISIRRAAGFKEPPSTNRITLLRDTTGDGVADIRTIFLDDLYLPFGMVLVGNDFYVANTNEILRFTYKEGETKIAEPGTKLVDLPPGLQSYLINRHWTRSLIASPDGSKLYVGIGSNSNIARYGMDMEVGRAAIWEIDRETGESRIYASGLRNPVGIGWEPKTDVLWAVVNERDGFGNDYFTSVKDGAFYGWPYRFFGYNLDAPVRSPTAVPDYALGSYVIALGLAFYTGDLLPETYQNGAFISAHGFWRRNPSSGYKVMFIPFKNGKPSGAPIDILTGFLSPKEQAYGRPVGLAVDKTGALLVADDEGDTIWRVTP